MRALVEIPGLQAAEQAIAFILDTGADTSVLMPDDYQRVPQLEYRDFLPYPLSLSFGFGGSFSARLVTATLVFRATDDARVPIDVAMDAVRQSPSSHGVPSVIGRDVTDLFHLTIDRSIGLISLTEAEGGFTGEFWPDGEPRSAD